MKVIVSKTQWRQIGLVAGWLVDKTAQSDDVTMSFSGLFEMNVAGKDYEFDYTATISDEHDDIKAERAEPTDMPDDLWEQVWEQVEDKASEVANERYRQILSLGGSQEGV